MRKYLAILATAVLGIAIGIQAQDSIPPDQGDQSAPPPASAPAPTPPLPMPPAPAQANGQVTTNGQAQVESGPGVARIGMIQGNVSTLHSNSTDWEAATLNTPVVVGDQVSTGDNSRAEVQLDYANILRLDQNSAAKATDLSRSRVLLQVSQGLVNFNVVRSNGPQAEIDTPNVAVKPQQPGSYRIEVDSDSETKVTVRSGSAQISTPQGSTQVNAGQMIEVQGTDNPQYQIVSAPAKDAWDDFNNERDHKIISAQSWSHTDPYYTGTQDMDGYGEWSEIPDYGPVWIPNTAPGWAPYRDGRWVYEPYWGWTWVSYEPWGWAPYHYGRWFMYGGSWAWWPGPVVGYPGYYPLWAPAYVSFFGFGRGWGVGFGFGFGGGWGTIGWLPIGPADYFRPWWGGWGLRGGYVLGVGGLYGFHDGYGPLYRGAHPYSNLNSVMANDRIRNGMTAMRGDEFGRAAVAGHMERVDASTFRQGSMLGGRLPVTASRASYQSIDRAASPSTMRGSAANQRFFSANQAPNRALSARAGMEEQRTPAAMNNGRSVGQAGSRSGGASGQGWHSFGEANNNAGRGFQGYGNRSGGQSFGQGGRPAFNSNSGYGASPRTSPSPSPSAGSRSYQGYGGGGSRPPLNMHQPIVTQRSYGGYGGESRGGYSRPSGGYSQPSYRGGGSYGGGGGGNRGGGGRSSGGHGGGRR